MSCRRAAFAQRPQLQSASRRPRRRAAGQHHVRNPVRTSLAYNPRGWLTQRALFGTGNSTTGQELTIYGHDNAGQLTQVTRPDSSYISLKYDPAHRLTDITDNLGNTIHYTLDAAGNSIQEDTRTFTGATPSRTVVRQFNALGQLAKTINADGKTVNGAYSYDPNGNPNVLTDGLNVVTNNTFDQLNRLYAIAQDPGSAPHVGAYTQLTLDALNRTTNVQDPHGLNTSYTYDGLNDLTQLTSPDTGTATSTYDTAGNLHTRTDARGVTATYTYDALNRVTGIAYTPVTTPSPNITLSYDVVPGGCSAAQSFTLGHLTYIQDVSGTTRMCYDRFGNMVQKQQVINGVTFCAFRSCRYPIPVRCRYANPVHVGT